MIDVMEEIIVSGSIVVLVGSEHISLDYAEWRGRAWLIPDWSFSDSGAVQFPTRMISPKLRDGCSPQSGVEILHIFKRLPLLPEVLYGNPPISCRSLIDIVDYPAVAVKANAGVDVELRSAENGSWVTPETHAGP